MNGYRSQAYVETLSHIGEPLQLQRSGSWLLLRQIGDYVDALGSYPRLFYDDLAAVDDDLEELASAGIVSLVVVAPDSFGTLLSVKPQYIVPLAGDSASRWSPHHRRRVRAARVDVVQTNMPYVWADEWIDLYAQLRLRHQIADGDMEAFPETALRTQLAVPGAIAFGCTAGVTGDVCGMLVFYDEGRVARYHLGAYSHQGYELGASYALFAAAFQYFADRGTERIDLGRAPVGSDGLARFKLGWGAEEVPMIVSGAIIRPDAYELLTRTRGEHRWFPAYRPPD